MVYPLHQRDDRLGFRDWRLCTISLGCNLHRKTSARRLENYAWAGCYSPSPAIVSPNQTKGARRVHAVCSDFVICRRAVEANGTTGRA